MAQTDDVKRTVPVDGRMRVSPKSEPAAVANAIRLSILNSHVYPEVRAVGHGAVGQACKAIAIARGLVGSNGIDLAVRIGFDTFSDDDGQEITAQVFHTFSNR